MRPEQTNTPSLFSLPFDVLKKIIIDRLNANGPAVLLIKDEPTTEQKKTVIATNVPALAWTEKQKEEYLKTHDTLPDTSNAIPDLNTYHLIVDIFVDGPFKGTYYFIGFCAKEYNNNNVTFAYKYKREELDAKSPLRRYITENPSVLSTFKAGRSQDRYLLRYMEHEVTAKGGLIANRFKNRVRFAGVNQFSNDWMNGVAIHDHKKAFEQTLQQTMLDELVHYVDYPDEHDQDRTTRVRKIIEADPSLLLSDHVAKNIRGCTPDCTFKAATAFQLAVYNGDWPMWEMMLDVIETYDFAKQLPKEQLNTLSGKDRQRYNGDKRTTYKTDLETQLNDLETHGLEVITDNLLNKGVRILDADVLTQHPNEAERMKQDVIERNAYQLIIKTGLQDNQRIVQSCRLACYDPNSKQDEDEGYCEIDLPGDDPLFHIALNLYNLLQNRTGDHGRALQHVVTRKEHVLSLIDQRLSSQGIDTKCTTTMTQFDYCPLQEELKILEKNFIPWSRKRISEHWHIRVSAWLRVLPDFSRRLLSSMPDTADQDELSAYVNRGPWLSLPVSKNAYDECLYPCSRSLGDKFTLTALDLGVRRGLCGPTMAYATGLPRLVLNDLDKNRVPKIRELKKRLANQPVPNDQKSFCSLM